MKKILAALILFLAPARGNACDITAAPGPAGPFTLGHASNDGLDHGPEKKNLGLDHIRAEVWF